MAFMMKKKKYKFSVDVHLEELTAVPFVSAVLFAKLRLLDGSFVDHASREEVQNHTVRWNAKFSFVCKMNANASTGVLDPCVLRISVRKELKGGRSFQKLGFIDLNLAEFAGSGFCQRRCLLEGYDARHRQDNSMLRVAIKMNMLSGDILFKVPSPSLKPGIIEDEIPTSDRGSNREDHVSSGSLAGSIASASSGFGSLPKKRPALFSSELLSGTEPYDSLTLNEIVPSTYPVETLTEAHTESGHSRNSSNTSQLSKGSGYGSLNSHSQHSRQSSSGDSGHIRSPSWPVWAPRLPSLSQNQNSNAPPAPPCTPTRAPPSPLSALASRDRFWSVESQKEHATNHKNLNNNVIDESKSNGGATFRIPSIPDKIIKAPKIGQPGWKGFSKTCDCIEKANVSPVLRLADQARAVSSPDPLHKTPEINLRASILSTTNQTLRAGGHRKLLDGTGVKLATVATSPDSEESSLAAPNVAFATNQQRNSIILSNPSGGSGLSETGSLDRAKSALERRKKAEDGTSNSVVCRVEVTRPNPDSLIDELLKATNLDKPDIETAETTGLQLFIGKDGTTMFNSHEVKSQMPGGVFKQVVMEENR